MYTEIPKNAIPGKKNAAFRFRNSTDYGLVLFQHVGLHLSFLENIHGGNALFYENILSFENNNFCIIYGQIVPENPLMQWQKVCYIENQKLTKVFYNSSLVHYNKPV